MRAVTLAFLLLAHPVHADQVLQVLEVRVTDTPAWGTNSAAVTIKNAAGQSCDVVINWQATSLMLGRGWGLDRTETIPAGETRSFAVEYIIPAFPGKVAFRFRIRDA